MNLKEKKLIANELHAKGYNCAQAVICAFAEELNEDEELLFKITEGFGGGMGAGEGTCGALSSAILMAGLKSSSANLDCPDSKKDTYRLSRNITDDFKDKVGAIICKEIKGRETGKPLCTCEECILSAVEIIIDNINFD